MRIRDEIVETGCVIVFLLFFGWFMYLSDRYGMGGECGPHGMRGADCR